MTPIAIAITTFTAAVIIDRSLKYAWNLVSRPLPRIEKP